MVKRQGIRKGILICSLLLFPLTLYYFSPYLILQGLAEGVLAGSFFVFLGMFLFSLVFGRLFCGWVCPAGGLGECLILAQDAKHKGGKRNWVKFGIWLPWLLGIAYFFLLNRNHLKADFLYQTESGISVLNIYAYVIYYAVLLLVVVLSLITGKRGFCHSVCWMAPFMIVGTYLKNRIDYPSLRLVSKSESCIHCMKCNKKCPMSLDVERAVTHQAMENSECILCGECVDVCPKQAIAYSFKKARKPLS